METFLGFFEMEAGDARSITKLLFDVLEKYQLDILKLRGQVGIYSSFLISDSSITIHYSLTWIS